MRNPPPLPGAERPLTYLRMLYALSRGRVAEGRRDGQRLLADTTGDNSVPDPLVRAANGWADIIEGDTLGGLRALRAGLEEAGYGMKAALNMGQALEAEGDAVGAVQAYSQFIRLWDQADPELQPLVETARLGLERLGAERTN